MLWLTENSTLICDHAGKVQNTTSQDWVRIAKQRVLIQPDPQNRTIVACPNSNPLAGIKSCMKTLEPREGYSALVRIGGHQVCLQSILGYTDGSPPRVANYKVLDPAQKLVSAAL